MNTPIAIFLAFAALVLAFIGTALWEYHKHNKHAEKASKYLTINLLNAGKKGSK